MEFYKNTAVDDIKWRNALVCYMTNVTSGAGKGESLVIMPMYRDIQKCREKIFEELDARHDEGKISDNKLIIAKTKLNREYAYFLCEVWSKYKMQEMPFEVFFKDLHSAFRSFNNGLEDQLKKAEALKICREYTMFLTPTEIDAIDNELRYIADMKIEEKHFGETVMISA